MATGNNSIITLKLLVDVRSQKVLFAEAGKDFVDFMFCLLTLPLGSVIQLITPSLMVGSIGKLYQSVDKLNETYLVANKAALLRPAMPSFHGVRLPLRLPSAETTTGVKYYACRSCYKKVTTTCNIYCPICGTMMNCILDLVVPSACASVSVRTGSEEENQGGFVKGVVTYMITDDLEITPLSAISSITLINRFGIMKDLQIEEKTATVGLKEGLALLMSSLKSRTVLTDVFLTKKAKSSV